MRSNRNMALLLGFQSSSTGKPVHARLMMQTIVNSHCGLVASGKNAVKLALNAGKATDAGVGDAELFSQTVLPMSLVARDVQFETPSGSVPQLEVARKAFANDGSEPPAMTPLPLAARTKLIQLGGKLCLDRAVSLQPRNPLGYNARGSLLANLADTSGAATMHALANFQTYLSLSGDAKSKETYDIAFRAGIITESLANKLVRSNSTLADVSNGAADELMGLLSFNASVLVEGVAMTAQVRPVAILSQDSLPLVMHLNT